jgi:hypothetical protein
VIRRERSRYDESRRSGNDSEGFAPFGSASRGVCDNRDSLLIKINARRPFWQLIDQLFFGKFRGRSHETARLLDFCASCRWCGCFDSSGRRNLADDPPNAVGKVLPLVRGHVQFERDRHGQEIQGLCGAM